MPDTGHRARGPGTAPAGGFAKELCSGSFHLNIKKQEKFFISSVCFFQWRLFFTKSSSPSPLFMAHEQPPAVELSPRFWPLSPLCPRPLLCSVSSTRALPTAGLLPAARSLLLPRASLCSSWEEHQARRPLLPQVTAQKPAEFPPGQTRRASSAGWDVGWKVDMSYPNVQKPGFKIFSLVLHTLCLLSLPNTFLYKHQPEGNPRCSCLHTSQKLSL